LDFFGLSDSLLPSIVPLFSEQVRVTAAAAAELGLKAGIPVTYRAGDQLNNTLSLNVFNPGEIASTAGTSGVVYGVSETVTCDPDFRVNFVTTMSFLTNYEKRVHVVDTEQTCKVKVAFVKDIAGKRFIFDIIHGFDIMRFCLRYEKCDRYLGRNVQLGVKLDSGFRTFKQCPVKQRKTQGNGGRVESVEFSWHQKFASLALRHPSSVRTSIPTAGSNV
jgi:hypothetical protein